MAARKCSPGGAVVGAVGGAEAGGTKKVLPFGAVTVQRAKDTPAAVFSVRGAGTVQRAKDAPAVAVFLVCGAG